jgi:hypothetical protein
MPFHSSHLHSCRDFPSLSFSPAMCAASRVRSTRAYTSLKPQTPIFFISFHLNLNQEIAALLLLLICLWLACGTCKLLLQRQALRLVSAAAAAFCKARRFFLPCRLLSVTRQLSQLLLCLTRTQPRLLARNLSVGMKRATAAAHMLDTPSWVSPAKFRCMIAPALTSWLATVRTNAPASFVAYVT